MAGPNEGEGGESLSHAATVWHKGWSSFCKIFAMGKLDQWVIQCNMLNIFFHTYIAITQFPCGMFNITQSTKKCAKSERIVRGENTAKTTLYHPVC